MLNDIALDPIEFKLKKVTKKTLMESSLTMTDKF